MSDHETVRMVRISAQLAEQLNADWSRPVEIRIHLRTSDGEPVEILELIARTPERFAALQEYAYHVEGCRECGEMSWTSCSDGKRLRLAAFPEETRQALGEDVQ